MKQCSFLIRFVLFASIIFFAIPAASEIVDGYNSYIELLPGGRPLQRANEEIVIKAQAVIVRLEAVKRKRKIRFIRPIDIVRLNSIYSMISFEVTHTSKFSSRFSKKPAIFSLLFEGNGPTGMKRYAESYIKWFGPSDIEQYHKSSAPKFCDIFIRSGVDDCGFEETPVAVKENEKKIKEDNKYKKEEKEKAPQVLSADMIKSGIIKAKYIDKSIVTERELSLALKSTVTESELNLALKENNNKLLNFCETADNQTENIILLRDKIKELEGIIVMQSEQAKKVEATVNALATILKGVSRSKNEILFSGMNLHLVNGSGRTHGNVNGTGNLIVGYNEKKERENLQLDSHEIIAPDQIDRIKKKTATSIANIDEESDSKLSGVCFINAAK